MSRIDALRALEAAIVAGDVAWEAFTSAFPPKEYGHATWHDAHVANLGSFDAALALHDAVMPHHQWDVWRTATYDGDPRLYGCNLPGIDTVYADTPPALGCWPSSVR